MYFTCDFLNIVSSSLPLHTWWYWTEISLWMIENQNTVLAVHMNILQSDPWSSNVKNFSRYLVNIFLVECTLFHRPPPISQVATPAMSSPLANFRRVIAPHVCDSGYPNETTHTWNLLITRAKILSFANIDTFLNLSSPALAASISESKRSDVFLLERCVPLLVSVFFVLPVVLCVVECISGRGLTVWLQLGDVIALLRDWGLGGWAVLSESKGKEEDKNRLLFVVTKHVFSSQFRRQFSGQTCFTFPSSDSALQL